MHLIAFYHHAIFFITTLRKYSHNPLLLTLHVYINVCIWNCTQIMHPTVIHYYAKNQKMPTKPNFWYLLLLHPLIKIFLQYDTWTMPYITVFHRAKNQKLLTMFEKMAKNPFWFWQLIVLNFPDQFFSPIFNSFIPNLIQIS